MLGVGLAVLLEFRDRTFRSAQDIHDVLQLPLMAHVPLVMVDADRRRLWRLRVFAAVAVVAVACVGAYGVWALQLWKFVV